jgi:hypothetical protein
VTVQRYRKKPVITEAIQWTGENIEEIWDWGGTAGIYGPTEKNPDQLILTTIHGEQAIARIDDWVLPEPVRDRFYPVKPEIFEATYEKVEG